MDTTTDQTIQQPTSVTPPEPAPVAPPQLPPDNSAPPSLPQAPAAVPSTNRWANVVKGALEGLVSHGIPGAIAGAVDPAAQQQAKQQAAQDVSSLRQAQSANLLADAAQRNAQIEALPAAAQERVIQHDETMLHGLLAQGVSPIITADKTAESALAAAKQVLGSGAHVFVLHLRDGFAAVDMNQLRPDTSRDMVNQMLRYTVPGRQYENGEKVPLNLVKQASEFFNPTDPKALPAYKNYLAAAKRNPNADPEEVAKLESAVKSLSEAANQPPPERTYNRYGGYIDENGKLTTTTGSDAARRGLAPATAGMQAGSKQSQFNEILSATSKVRGAITNLDQDFTPQEISKIELAMSRGKGVAAANVKSFLGTKNLTPQQQDFVVWVTQLNERALSLRNVAGMGQGAQDIREAIRAGLPNAASGSKEMMVKQLDAFENQVNQLRGGVPKVKGLGGNGPAPAAPTSKQNDPLGIL